MSGHLCRSRTSLDSIGRCTLCVRSSSAATSGHAENIVMMKNSVIGASSHCFAQRPVIAADACCCRATDRTCPVPIRAASGHLCRARFFTILRPAWFLSSCLRVCLILYVFYVSSNVFLEVLIIGSSRRLHPSHILHPIELQKITCKSISPIWLCWSSNTKMQSKWAKDPFSL